MDPGKTPITFTLIYSGKEYRVQTFKHEYYSLMNLISVRLGIAGFGLCSGMGSCGTCRVGVYEKLPGHERVALSCDLSVDEDLSNTIIVITETRY